MSSILFQMQASTIEKPSFRPQLNSSVKVPQQKEEMKSRYFMFTAEDLYNCLHQKSGKVEAINLEETRFNQFKENATGTDTGPSCKCGFFYSSVYLFVPWLVGGLFCHKFMFVLLNPLPQNYCLKFEEHWTFYLIEKHQSHDTILPPKTSDLEKKSDNPVL